MLHWDEEVRPHRTPLTRPNPLGELGTCGQASGERALSFFFFFFSGWWVAVFLVKNVGLAVRLEGKIVA